jgi:hypothetical protein
MLALKPFGHAAGMKLAPRMVGSCVLELAAGLTVVGSCVAVESSALEVRRQYLCGEFLVCHRCQERQKVCMATLSLPCSGVSVIARKLVGATGAVAAATAAAPSGVGAGAASGTASVTFSCTANFSTPSMVVLPGDGGRGHVGSAAAGKVATPKPWKYSLKMSDRRPNTPAADSGVGRQ